MEKDIRFTLKDDLVLTCDDGEGLAVDVGNRQVLWLNEPASLLIETRVYQSVVPHLAQGIVAACGLRKPTAQDLGDTYEMALTVLFRLLFIAYAEDKNLLPYRWNGLYQRHSLKTKAQELAELARTVHPSTPATRCGRRWRASAAPWTAATASGAPN